METWGTLMHGGWMVTAHTREPTTRKLVAWWPRQQAGLDVITFAEMQASARRARGASLKVLASELGRSAAGVSNLLASARRKLGLRCPSELVAFFSSWPANVVVHAEQEGDERFVVVGYPPPLLSLPRCLSNAEQRVVRGLVAGWSHKAIAEAHGIAVRTVVNQVASVHQKLAVHSQLELLAVLQRDAQRVSP
jgi:DNA-binding CsgD family transcriptional regulator